MLIRPFALERYFAAHEFRAEHLLSSSDCESLSLEELLRLATPAGRALWTGLRLGYTESSGHPRLRAAVARGYRGLRAEDVLVAAPEEAIFLAMQALLSPGDEVVVVSPAYQSLHELPRSLGCAVKPWPVRPAGGGWTVDLDELERAVGDRARMLVVNFPHNPTGHQLAREELEAVVAVARRHGLWLFSDEMYRLLEPDPAARLPAACELYERGISLAGLSKAHGLPGLRIGWLATRAPEVLERCLAVKDYTTICNGAPGEVLAVVALEAQEVLLRRSLSTVGANLAVAEAFFAEHRRQVEWLPPRAGSVAFPRWLGAGPVEALCRRALEEEGLMVVPGSLFQHPGGHFRVGLGRAGFPQALERLGRVLARSSG
jgi:aspartate/methionine/tyrosine aminotransferase